MATRYYSEELLNGLPLRVRQSETEIQKAHNVITAHPTYLEKMPKRRNAEIPSYEASRCTYGWFTDYAEVFREIKGLPSVAIIVSKLPKSIVCPRLAIALALIFIKMERERMSGANNLCNIY